MTPEQFVYWLQGYAELGGPVPTPEQWQIITDHLKHVFDKRTPSRTPVQLPLDFSQPPAQPPFRHNTDWPPLMPTVTC